MTDWRITVCAIIGASLLDPGTMRSAQGDDAPAADNGRPPLVIELGMPADRTAPALRDFEIDSAPGSPRNKELSEPEYEREAAYTVAVDVSSQQRVVDMDLGKVDTIRPIVIKWTLLNRSNQNVDLLRVESDCACVRLLTESKGPIPSKGSFSGYIEYNHEIMGSSTRRIKFQTTTGDHSVTLRAVASRGVYFNPSRELQAGDDGLTVRVGMFRLMPSETDATLDLSDIEFDRHVLTLVGRNKSERFQDNHDVGNSRYSVVEWALRFEPAKDCSVGWHNVPIDLRLRAHGSRKVAVEKTLHSLIHVERGFQVRPSATTTGYLDKRYDTLPTTRVVTVQYPDDYSFDSARLENTLAGITLVITRDGTSVNFVVTFSDGIAVNQPIDTAIVAEFENLARTRKQSVRIPVKGFVLDRFSTQSKIRQ